MIDFVEGDLVEKAEDHVVVGVGGIGFAMHVSANTLKGLPPAGKKVRLYGYLYVKEDMLQLFGFRDRRERQLFLQLLGVTGIGPRAAMALLSAYDPDTLVRLVAAGDLDALTAVSGVGKKSGQRIILELKDRLAPLAGDLAAVSGGQGGGDLLKEAREALKGLGYTPTEASRALEGYRSEDPRLEDMIRYALRRLGGQGG
ncbi:MAG: Holliday junction branch migration protein RuvA [Actinobacteria bacterium]|nr:Holliday junction branch migration protein RuvA [Actinomycetota bacterium]